MSEAKDEAEHYFSAGLITQFEREAMILGSCVVNQNEQLVWIRLVSVRDFAPPEPRALTPDRMIEIQADHLLGIGDGRTTLPQQPNQD